MIIRAVELRLVGVPLVRPFRTSFGETNRKECVLVKVETDLAEGWGECVADIEPDFSGEFNAGVWIIIRDFLAPALFHAGEIAADGLAELFSFIRGNPMAKGAVVDAVLDAQLKGEGRSLSSQLGSERDRVPCGVSVGITPTTEELLAQVDGYLAEGYQRIKLKIAPGVDIDRVAAVRAAHPDILLSVDANAAYRLADLDTFKALEDFNLLMIEQPLHYEDILQHAKLQSQLGTDVCLDESIRSPADAATAIELGACRIVNIKQGRVGGVLEAVKVHDVARAAGVPVWCGGMLETGIGRALNLALASLPGFTLPGDTSASARYFTDDLTEPFVMAPDGTMALPTGPGIGVDPRPDRLLETTISLERVQA